MDIFKKDVIARSKAFDIMQMSVTDGRSGSHPGPALFETKLSNQNLGAFLLKMEDMT
ncbi:unnamed protein product [marine sediment metagenome]|uniref:Uncharacterized protein n=1 Tax=marine sediment metagenome TaxID=412755 RepID=X1P9R5_9ZZZZ